MKLVWEIDVDSDKTQVNFFFDIKGLVKSI